MNFLGESFNHSDWANFEPSGHGETSIQIEWNEAKESYWEWNDASHTEGIMFICESPK